jgi:hypothetical protein
VSDTLDAHCKALDRALRPTTEPAGDVIAAAYVCLLMIPLDHPLRERVQITLARCRDWIAEATNNDSESVQDEFALLAEKLAKR